MEQVGELISEEWQLGKLELHKIMLMLSLLAIHHKSQQQFGLVTLTPRSLWFLL